MCLGIFERSKPGRGNAWWFCGRVFKIRTEGARIHRVFQPRVIKRREGGETPNFSPQISTEGSVLSLSLSSWPRVTMVKIHPSSILIFEISFLLYIQSTGYSLGGKWNCEEARQRVPFFFFLPVGFRAKFQRFPCFNIFFFFFFGFSFFSVAMSIGTKKNKGIPCWRGCFSFDPFFSFSPFFFRIFSFMHGIEV